MKKSPSFKIYFLLSIAAHVLAVGVMLLFNSFPPKSVNPDTVNIDFLDAQDLEKMAQAEALLQKKSELLNNQIVEQNEDTANQVAPENARFLSAKNQTVKKQTVAKNRGEFQNLKKEAPQKTGPKGDGRQKNAAVAEESRKQIEKDLFDGFNSKNALFKQKPSEVAAGLGEGQGNGEQNNGIGKETSQSNDYLKDVDSGLETLLNTREFKYYSYYNRIRKQLSQHWEGRVRNKLTKLFKEGRAPAATNKDRITKLMITLNDAGTLVRVQVISDSGVRDLDEAAIEAFRAAAPFPNPPEGIIENDGTVKIRWDFVLEV